MYWPRTAAIILLFTVVLLQNFGFVRERMSFHKMLGAPFRQAVTLATEAGEEEKGVVFVNLPAWLAPGRATYALGHEGVQFWPDYALPETLVGVNGGEAISLALVQDETIRPEMSYYYGLSGSPTDWQSLKMAGNVIFVTDYQDEGIFLRQAGTLGDQNTAGGVAGQFGQPPSIFLTGADATRTGDGLEINLGWQVDQPPPEHITVFVHVVDKSGILVAQGDGDPFGGTYPLNRWAPGTGAEDIRFINDGGLGQQILVGLYNRLTGERLPAFSPEGIAWPDEAISVEIR